jgi:hypothetical protein
MPSPLSSDAIMTRLITFALAAVLFLVTCGDDDAGTSTTTLPEGAVIAEFLTPDASFKVLLTGDAAEQARTAFADGTQPGIPNGRSFAVGGVNRGHDWH